MYYVYLIRNANGSGHRYVGYTEDVRSRITEHNEGKNPSTAPFRPWELVSYHAFESKKRALDFEQYLKSGSGHAFSNKRLW